jgi:general secretion pathway protein H
MIKKMTSKKLVLATTPILGQTPKELPDKRKCPSVKSLGSVKGFTLFEIIVVVIIVTISVSAILFSTSFISGSSDLKLLGNDLSKTMRLLYQEAIFENKNFAISVNHQGFKVLEYDGQDWVESAQSFFRKVKLNESQHSNLIIENLVVESVEQSDPVPHILILSSGEMTPFEWHIRDSDTNTSVTIFGDFLGNILASDPAPLS